MNIDKHVHYWRTGAEEDFEAAEELLEKGKERHALFFAHLSLEKILKAHVTRATGQLPPKSHVLILLADRAHLNLSANQREFLEDFDNYQIEGRYPDLPDATPPPGQCRRELQKAKEMMLWLTSQL